MGAKKAGLDWVKEQSKEPRNALYEGIVGLWAYESYDKQKEKFLRNNILVPTITATSATVRAVPMGNSILKYRQKIQGIYDPLPKHSIFGTALALRLPVFSSKMMAWIKINAAIYGFAWSWAVPTTDPLFPRIIHYYYGTKKPPYFNLYDVPIRLSRGTGY